MPMPTEGDDGRRRTAAVREAVHRGIHALLGRDGSPRNNGVGRGDRAVEDDVAIAIHRATTSCDDDRARARFDFDVDRASSHAALNAAVTALTHAAMDETIAERMARDVAKRATETLARAKTRREGVERGVRRACASLGKSSSASREDEDDDEDVADVRAVAIEQLRIVLGGVPGGVCDYDSEDDAGRGDAATHPMRAFYERDDSEDDSDDDDDVSSAATRVSIEKVLADEEGFVAAVVDAFARLRVFFARDAARRRNRNATNTVVGRPNTEVQITATTTASDGRTTTKTFKLDATKSVVAKEKIERDLQTVRRWSEETSEAARRVVREWLAETQTIDAMGANLRRRVVDERATMRQIQQRELLSHALASWGDLRSAVAALELGVEELKFCERRAKYYLDENENCYRRVSTAEDAESLERLLLDEIEGHRTSFVAAAPNAREMEDRTRACVLKIRAVNSCDAARGGGGLSGTMRKMTSRYPDGDMDVKRVLADALDDVKASYRDLMDEFNDDDDDDAGGGSSSSLLLSSSSSTSSSSALMANANRRDATALYARIEPILNRYADTTLSRVIQRVVRALNREGAALTRGIDLARCAVFAHVFAGVAVAHAKAVDDELLESVLREFEERDEEAARIKSAKAVKRKKSRTRKKEIRRMMTLQQQQQKDDPPTDDAPSPKETNDDDDDDDDDDDEENDDDHVVVEDVSVIDKENVPPPPSETIDDDGSDAGWTKARSRRKSSSSSPAQGIKTPIPEPRVSATKTIPPPKPLLTTPSISPCAPPPTATMPAPPKHLPPAAAHPPLPPGPAPESAQLSRPRPQTSIDDARRPQTAIPPPRVNFPPKPKANAKTRPPLRSIAEYKRMLGTESESDRESRLKEFPALTSTNGSTTAMATNARKSSSSSTLPIPRIVPALRPPPRQKSWAEAKLSIDGVKLPSLIKIK